MTITRQDLEDAAKAAGFSCRQSKHGYLNLTFPSGRTESYCHSWPAYDASTGNKLPGPTLIDAVIESGWNPLHDGNDTIELMLKAGISAADFGDGSGWRVEAASWAFREISFTFDPTNPDDMREKIVLCAAEKWRRSVK